MIGHGIHEIHGRSRQLWALLMAFVRAIRVFPAPSSVMTVAGVNGMNKEMIISSGAHDTRVAILEDDQVVEIFIERENQRGVVGNIYKGRVSKVLPGMQSSFIDIGLERDAFLYVTEVINTVEEFDKLAGEDEDEVDEGPKPLGEIPEPPAEGT